jgi:hypothetical protein
VGIVGCLGTLSKYAMGLWFVGLLAFLLIDRRSRGWLVTPWPYVALVIALAGFASPVVWNIENDWVTARHVGRQTGMTHREGDWFVNPLFMLVTQVGVWGPVMTGFLIASLATRGRANTRETRLLVCFGLGYFLLVLLASFRTEIEPNWPAPAYFTLTILVAGWIGSKLASIREWKPIRGFFWTHVIIGLFATVYLHRSDLFYPVLDQLGINPRKLDAQLVKTRGNAEIARRVDGVRSKMPREPMILSPHYQEASLLHFYLRGHPTVFNVGPFLHGPERTRLSQFDLWKQTDLTDVSLIGRDAIYVGGLDRSNVIRGAFESVEALEEIVIRRHGVEVRRKSVYLLRGFKGLRRAGTTSY